MALHGAPLLLSMKSGFYCYISASDDGTVKLRLDAATSEMYVTFSESSGCYVALYEVPGGEERS